MQIGAADPAKRHGMMLRTRILQRCGILRWSSIDGGQVIRDPLLRQRAMLINAHKATWTIWTSSIPTGLRWRARA